MMKNKYSLKNIYLNLCNKAIKLYYKNTSDIVITGIPRSGTSLLSSILDNNKNCICFNETFPSKWNTKMLPYHFKKTRNKIIKGKKVINRVEEKGRITSDTQKNKYSKQYISYNPKLDEKLIIASKRTIPYIEQLNRIINSGYKVIALIRNPYATLNSWERLDQPNVPVCGVDENNLHPMWKKTKIKFSSAKSLERKAQAWNYLASKLLTHKSQIKIIKYEELVQNKDEVLDDISEWIGLEIYDHNNIIKEVNFKKNYPKAIKRAVDKWCTNKKFFDY